MNPKFKVGDIIRVKKFDDSCKPYGKKIYYNNGMDQLLDIDCIIEDVSSSLSFYDEVVYYVSPFDKYKQNILSSYWAYPERAVSLAKYIKPILLLRKLIEMKSNTMNIFNILTNRHEL